MRQNPILLIRVDASLSIGMGHVMRCIALAQAWKRRGGRCVLVSMSLPLDLKQQIKQQGFRCLSVCGLRGSALDAKQTLAWAKKIKAAWIVVDGYDFGEDYQRRIRAAGFPLLLVDDYGHAIAYNANLVLNQNAYASPKLYRSREPYTRLLLGPRFLLLRDEFLKIKRKSIVARKSINQVLVSLGGSDPANITQKVVSALLALRNDKVKKVIVLGACNPHLAAIRAKLRGRREFQLEINTMRMPKLMAASDVAISAGGTTAWELAFMGLPGQAMILSDNQREIVRYLHRMGITHNLGETSDLTVIKIGKAIRAMFRWSVAKRARMARHGKMLVDGKGSERVISAMLALGRS